MKGDKETETEDRRASKEQQQTGAESLKGKPVHQQNYCNNKQEQFDNWSASQLGKKQNRTEANWGAEVLASSLVSRIGATSLEGGICGALEHSFRSFTRTQLAHGMPVCLRVCVADTVSYIFIGLPSKTAIACICSNCAQIQLSAVIALSLVNSSCRCQARSAAAWDMNSISFHVIV